MIGRVTRWGWLLCMAATALGACESGGLADAPEGGGPGVLATAGAWVETTRAGDPFPDHRPATVSCPRAGWTVEDRALEVSTNACNYLTVEQPLMRDVERGREIEVTLWHQALFAEQAAVAHVALVVGDAVIWERDVPIPAPAEVWRDTVEAPGRLPAGERVIFHLHNHGANTWNLGDVRLGAEGQ
jgi:hypothetical protein